MKNPALIEMFKEKYHIQIGRASCRERVCKIVGGVILVISLLFMTLQNSWNVISILGDVMLLASNGGVLIQRIVFLLKAHEYHFLFSSSQFRVFKAFKYPNSPTIRSFITLSKSLQISSRISKISSCFSLHKFSLRISLYLLRKPPRPVIFSSTYLELVGLSV